MDDETTDSVDTAPDSDVLTAKISELENAIVERDNAIAERDAEIVRWKAANYDLLMQVPGSDDAADDDNETTDDGDDPDVDDLFD